MASLSHRNTIGVYSISPPQSSGLLNVKDYGAKGDGGTDDRVILQSAIAYVQANNYMGLYFPTGTYIVSRNPTAGVTALGSLSGLDLLGASNLTIQGAGFGTVIKMSTLGTQDYYLLRMRQASNIIVRDLVLDGNHELGASEAGLGEQLHLIGMVSSSSATNQLTDVLLHNVTFRKVRGDGVKIAGVNTAHTERITISNCRFDSCARAGVVFAGFSDAVTIANNTFVNSKRGDIDSEPSGTSSVTRSMVVNNQLDHTYNAGAIACSLSGSGSVVPAEQIVFANNVVLNGCVEGGNVGSLVIQGNRITMPLAGTDDSASIRLHGKVNSAQITNNHVHRAAGTASQCILVDHVSTSYPDSVVISGNVCRQGTASGIIKCENSNNVSVANNVCTFETTLAGTLPGILWSASATNISGCSITGNTVKGDVGGSTLTYGIQVGGTNAADRLVITGNNVSGANTGLRLESTVTFTTPPAVSGNHLNVATPITASTPIMISGSTGGVAIYQGSGAPTFTAAKGSVYHRTDGTAGSGGAAGTLRYLNTTGATTWVALIDA